MRTLKSRLELGLTALGCVVESAPRAASTHLEAYQELCLPLMSSWLVGECHPRELAFSKWSELGNVGVGTHL